MHSIHVTKAELVRQSRDLLAEAFALDTEQTCAAVQLVFGSPVFAWDAASVQQLRALRRWCLVVRLSASVAA